MPIYEYRCALCGAKSEILVRARATAPTCPNCGSPLLEKLFSTPYVMSAETARPKGRTCCGQAERCATPPALPNKDADEGDRYGVQKEGSSWTKKQHRVLRPRQVRWWQNRSKRKRSLKRGR